MLGEEILRPLYRPDYQLNSSAESACAGKTRDRRADIICWKISHDIAQFVAHTKQASVKECRGIAIFFSGLAAAAYRSSMAKREVYMRRVLICNLKFI